MLQYSVVLGSVWEEIGGTGIITVCLGPIVIQFAPLIQPADGTGTATVTVPLLKHLNEANLNQTHSEAKPGGLTLKINAHRGGRLH